MSKGYGMCVEKFMIPRLLMALPLSMGWLFLKGSRLGIPPKASCWNLLGCVALIEFMCQQI